MQAETMSNELSAVNKIIKEIVAEAWEREKRAMPLARLGKILEERGFIAQKILSGRKLKEYIESDLAEFVKVVASPKSDLTYAAISALAPLDGDISSYFRPATRQTIGLPYQRLNSVFWHAFTRPIAPDFVRTIDFEPIPRFQDVSPAAAEAGGKPKITSDDLVFRAADLSEEQLREQVGMRAIEWADKNGVARNIVQGSNPTPTKQPSHANPPTAQTNLLFRVVKALSDEELKSMSMPLLVVKRLLEAD